MPSGAIHPNNFGTDAVDASNLIMPRVFFLSPTDPRMCYSPEIFERLQQVKARFDPGDLFRANPPIPSAAAY